VTAKALQALPASLGVPDVGVNHVAASVCVCVWVCVGVCAWEPGCARGSVRVCVCLCALVCACQRVCACVLEALETPLALLVVAARLSSTHHLQFRRVFLATSECSHTVGWESFWLDYFTKRNSCNRVATYTEVEYVHCQWHVRL
jgi:hypothetical protein